MSLSASFLFCSLSSVLVAVILRRQTPVITLICLTGKIGVSVAFTVLYLYTAELFPTFIRSTVMVRAVTMLIIVTLTECVSGYLRYHGS